MLTYRQKRPQPFNKKSILNDDCFRKLVINVVSAVFYCNIAAFFKVGNNRNRLAAVTAEREEECIEFFIVGFNSLDDIFFAFFSKLKIHVYHLTCKIVIG